MIELQDASVVTSDGETTILHPTSLTLAERRISIIGANGSGKSTLARLCNGLIEPSSGTVHVRVGADRENGPHAPGAMGGAALSDPPTASPPMPLSPTHPDSPAAPAGRDSGDWLDVARNGPAVRRRVGFVFSAPGAQLVMPTAIEDVTLSLRRTHKRKTERREAALAALDRFGLRDLADQSVHTLSGGQSQLLAIASVLATDPEILVADEPTTLLDLRNARMIADLLMGLPQQVIVVTHDLDFAARAERTLVIADGCVAFDGAPDDAIDFYRRAALDTGEGSEGNVGASGEADDASGEADGTGAHSRRTGSTP